MGLKITIKKEYGILVKPATAWNPQANYIIERIHRVLANLICTFGQEKNYIDEDDPWKGILAAADYDFRSTFHTPNKNHLAN